MILIGLSIVFLWLAVRAAMNPFSETRFDVYFFTMIVLAIGSASFPVRHALFEHKLGTASAQLVGKDHVVVECLSQFSYGSIFHFRAAGYVYWGSDTINMQGPICSDLKGYLSDPQYADPNELFALHVLTHEAMHVGGVRDEIVTDCKAFQRNHRMAALLGVDPKIARFNAQVLHRFRSPSHPYYSAACHPGGPMDDRLPDAVWQGNANIDAEQVARELITALAAITGGQEGTPLTARESMVPTDILSDVLEGARGMFTTAKDMATGLVTTVLGMILDAAKT